ncbi:MAG: hypothetical protein GX963_10710, partial [Bacteroidales bacterium]|nr:hypothetical protein [Bacteroidales bacterium]
RMVVDQGGAVAQITHYYPFGMSFAESTNASKQPYKYNGKELDMENNLNTYDYETRLLSVAVPRFTTMDPLAEKYYSISPYVYVGNNPIIRTDPTGMAWFYYSLDGKKDPTWNWRDEDEYNTGVYDTNGDEVVLKGTEAVVVFKGYRNEKLGKGNKINGDGAKTATATVYGPKGSDDIHIYTGYTMTSNAQRFGPIDEGIYDGNYDVNGKTGKLKSHWVLNHRGPIRMLDGKINPNAPSQIDSNGEGYKTGIFIHSTNKNGGAGGYVSTGCLLIHPDHWSGFNNVMSGVKNFKVQVIRQIIYKTPLTNFIGQEVPRLYSYKFFNKTD